MNLFMTIKAAVTVRQAAEYYGLKVDRSNMTCCPFHSDKNPSMKLNDDYYYCFGCHATGDVIDFTARFFNLTQGEAARKLAHDFGISPDPAPAGAVLPVPKPSQKDEWYCASVMIDYERFLKKQIERFAPKDPDEVWDERFCAACHHLTKVSSTIDELFSADYEDRRETAARLLEDGTIQRIENYLKHIDERVMTNGKQAESAARELSGLV